MNYFEQTVPLWLMQATVVFMLIIVGLWRSRALRAEEKDNMRIEDLPEPTHSFVIKWEDAGVISKERCWICFADGYMYQGDTLQELLEDVIHYWKDESRMTG